MEFYIMRDKCSNLYAKAIAKDNECNKRICELCSGVHVELNDLLKVYFKGKKQTDLYSASFGEIVSERFQKILTDNRITGFNLKEIHSLGWYNKDYKELDYSTAELKELSVTGKAGLLRRTSGELVPHCLHCNKVFYPKNETIHGFSVIEDWDGTDIFKIENVGFIVISEKLAKIIVKEKLKNIELINIKDHVFY